MSERFTIADVARMHGIRELRTNNSETYCVCPFCGNSKGKFSYIVKKGKKENMYHCWSCDSKGGSVDLHIALSSNIDYSGDEGYKQACRDIFSALKGDEVLQEMHKRDIENAPEAVDETIRNSDMACSAVYYAMLKELSLRAEHKANLLSRGLSEDDIARFKFKSTPKDPKGLCRKLVSKGYNLEGVPGFYKDGSGEWNLHIAGEGYFCPVYDGEMNYLLGFQIRTDKGSEKDSKFPKYVWVSSVNKEKGCSSGALVTCLPGKHQNTIIITEGILKATVIYCLLNKEVTVIGVPGVNATNALASYISRYSIGYVYEAFDMDKHVNCEGLDLSVKENLKKKEKTEGILSAAQNVRDMISEAYKLPTHELTWDFDEKGYWKEQYKGLDDFLSENPAYLSKFISYIVGKAEKNIKIQKFTSECVA